MGIRTITYCNLCGWDNSKGISFKKLIPFNKVDETFGLIAIDTSAVTPASIHVCESCRKVIYDTLQKEKEQQETETWPEEPDLERD